MMRVEGICFPLGLSDNTHVEKQSTISLNLIKLICHGIQPFYHFFTLIKTVLTNFTRYLFHPFDSHIQLKIKSLLH